MSRNLNPGAPPTAAILTRKLAPRSAPRSAAQSSAASPGGRRGSNAGDLLVLAKVFDDCFERVDDFVLRRPALVEAEFEVEGFGRRAEGEDVVLRAAGLGLGRGVAELLA